MNADIRTFHIRAERRKIVCTNLSGVHLLRSKTNDHRCLIDVGVLAAFTYCHCHTTPVWVCAMHRSFYQWRVNYGLGNRFRLFVVARIIDTYFD